MIMGNKRLRIWPTFERTDFHVTYNNISSSLAAGRLPMCLYRSRPLQRLLLNIIICFGVDFSAQELIVC